MVVATIFEREVRLERGANRAITKAQQANIDTTYMGSPPTDVNHSFCSAPTTACSICQLITNGLTQHQDEQPQQQRFAETQPRKSFAPLWPASTATAYQLSEALLKMAASGNTDDFFGNNLTRPLLTHSGHIRLLPLPGLASSSDRGRQLP